MQRRGKTSLLPLDSENENDEFILKEKKERLNPFRIALVLWMILVIYGECLSFRLSVGMCDLSTELETASFDENLQTSKELVSFSRVIVVSDPQLTDPYSYSFAKSGSSLLSVIQFYSDIYMKRAWYAIQKSQKVQAIVFLGDLFDGAKILKPEERKLELDRWNWIFHTTNRKSVSDYEKALFEEKKRERIQTKKKLASPEEDLENFRINSIELEMQPAILNVSGNHDVGYRIDPSLQRQLISNFKNDFGPVNWITVVGGFDIVSISSLTLETTRVDIETSDETWRFLEALDAIRPERPRILLCHVPLYRPPDTPCGKYNVQGPIKEKVGYSYTNMLSREMSHKILSMVKPVYVLSGDNHDHCEYTHYPGPPPLTERTVGTFSWLQGILWPSFAILTLHRSSVHHLVEYDICFLPSQLLIYMSYIVSLLVTVGYFFYSKRKENEERMTSKEVLISSLKSTLSLASILFPVYFIMLWISSR